MAPKLKFRLDDKDVLVQSTRRELTMKKIERCTAFGAAWGSVLLAALTLSACGGGGRDSILGADGTATRAPTVTAVTPTSGATAVPTSTRVVSATFSEAMQPIAGGASFTVSCDAPCVSPVATVTLDASNTIALFTLNAGSAFEPLTVYTATVGGARSRANGLALESPFVWRFTVGIAPDTTRPKVSATQPVTSSPGLTANVPVTTLVTATFTEDMAPATLNRKSFTLSCAAPCISPVGSVAYDVGTRTVAFTPTAALAASSTYTARVRVAATDLAGNALQGNRAAAPAASQYVWSFTTQSRPTVTATAPLSDATGVTLNTAASANFSEPVQPLSGAASFTLTCAAPCSNPSGTVELDASNTGAVFTPAAGTSLQANTLYTATVTGASSRATGLAMASPYVWHFTTGMAADSTRPQVATTQPLASSPGPTQNVPTNTAVTASFTEDMAPTSLSASSFRLTCANPCVAPTGAVSYNVGSRTAMFSSSAKLDASTTYTATVTMAATDLAGNALAGNQAPPPAASDYVWEFTTTAPAKAAQTNISVQSTDPMADATGVCPSATVNASFMVPSDLRMDPATVNSVTFTLVGPAPGFAQVRASSVHLDMATGRIASFTPQNALSSGLTYRATIQGGSNGVKDLATPGNQMLNDFSWSFSVGSASGHCLAPIELGSAQPFGSFGGSAGMTNQGLKSIINGDIGTTSGSTSMTGFHDEKPGCTYTETPFNKGMVNGNIYTAAPSPTADCPSDGNAQTFAIASKGRADALQAYNDLVALPPGTDPGAGNLANLVLTPGVYTSASGAFSVRGGNLTLDAQGNVNGVWVFQMASSLTVGGPGATSPQSVILVNGAQAKNVFWQVGSAATINAAGGGTMVGTIITQAGSDISTAGNLNVVTINGRILSLGASVTLINTVINVPGP